MTIPGFMSTRKKAAAAVDAALAVSLRRRMAERIAVVDKARRKAEVGTERGDMRDSRREPVYRVGTAVFEPGEEANCRIVDQSFSGLRLEMENADACPDEFALTIPTLRFIGIVRKAWRSDRQVGVSILRWSEAA